jgi:hypothetical protein
MMRWMCKFKWFTALANSNPSSDAVSVVQGPHSSCMMSASSAAHLRSVQIPTENFKYICYSSQGMHTRNPPKMVPWNHSSGSSHSPNSSKNDCTGTRDATYMAVQPAIDQCNTKWNCDVRRSRQPSTWFSVLQRQHKSFHTWRSGLMHFNTLPDQTHLKDNLGAIWHAKTPSDDIVHNRLITK